MSKKNDIEKLQRIKEIEFLSSQPDWQAEPIVFKEAIRDLLIRIDKLMEANGFLTLELCRATDRKEELEEALKRWQKGFEEAKSVKLFKTDFTIYAVSEDLIRELRKQAREVLNKEAKDE